MSPSRRRKAPTPLLSISPPSYAVLVLLLTSAFLLGLATDFSFLPRFHWPDFAAHKDLKPSYEFPDFNKVIHFRTLSARDAGLDDPSRRLLVIGDVHGMNGSLHDLLAAASWNSNTDTLMFAGDIMAKSSHSGSLAVLDFITRHECGSAPGRVHAVRGNHDQMVTQWRAWRDWFEPLELQLLSSSVPPPSSDTRPGPPVHTGRAFLDLIESEWEYAQKHDPKGSSDPEEWADIARKRAAGTWRSEWWRRVPRSGKGHANKDFIIFADHYWIAKDMSQAQRECLYSMPLVLHVPSDHFFVVHAGLLPSDPKRPLMDKRQPLAHPPHLISESTDGRTRDYDEISAYHPPASQRALTVRPESLPIRNRTSEKLRTAQEIAILTDIADNRDPWALLNMRGVRKSGKVTRRNDKGKPWSKLWNNQIKRCGGFDTWSESEDADSDVLSLPCEPATVVYGHAATRGLDIKRWSMGVDTGCLYGRQLTALVLQRKSSNPEALPGDHLGDDDDEEEEEEYGGGDDDDDERRGIRGSSSLNSQKPKRKPKMGRVQFGDDDSRIDARIVSVECPDGADADTDFD
ncbi:uncharacterized protein FIBRA_06390 [Fibroporia radiculosa]|uniref:Calcineurin-like phosphoesterase domain-containing protein n=1 Tax=Fibroporia radiculosa TaxID=599839 RepID=J4GBC5_9APHY|nr:uncharacterized protein FIBRA_06390 [Fibroporia radiculosa]CCM04223.1 predicted protein [Fibroporia radiculosa]